MNEARGTDLHALCLVADDDASLRFVLRAALEDGGHEVTEASGGGEEYDAVTLIPTELYRMADAEKDPELKKAYGF